MSKHTSGPWVAECFKGGGFDVIAPTSGHSGGVLVLCSRSEHLTREEEMHDNARLIAAAPEMLEALQVMCEYTAELNPNQGFDGNDCDAVNMARAAIKKATGE